MAFVSSVQTGYDKLFHVQMLVRVMVYSGISISVATHSQNTVATRKPMKNSRVNSLRTSASYWKRLGVLGLNVVLDAIVLSQQPHNLLSSTLLYAQIVCGEGTTVDIHGHNLVQYIFYFYCHFNPCLWACNGWPASPFVAT